MIDTSYLAFLVGGMLLASVIAVGAVLAGFWLAGRLAGLFGAPARVVSSPDIAVASGLVDRDSDVDEGFESVPWLDDSGQPVPEDPGADPDKWEEAQG